MNKISKNHTCAIGIDSEPQTNSYKLLSETIILASVNFWIVWKKTTDCKFAVIESTWHKRIKVASKGYTSTLADFIFIILSHLVFDQILVLPDLKSLNIVELNKILIFKAE